MKIWRWSRPFKLAIFLLLLGAALLLGGRVAVLAAPTDAQRCEAAKLKAAGSFALCRTKAGAKFAKTGDAGKLFQSLAMCSDKITVAYSNAESKWPSSCPTDGDALQIQAQIIDDTNDLEIHTSGLPLEPHPCLSATGQTKCYDFVGGEIACVSTGQDGDVQAGRPQSFLDNGDGTVSDLNTGLMWEKKSDDDSINDVDLQYPFSSTSLHADALNQSAFAGYTDWRIPNVRELESIIDYGLSDGTGIPPEFDKDCAPGCSVFDCSCNGPVDHHRTTTPFYNPFNNPHTVAWVTFFKGTAISFNVLKTTPGFVRAVRGGL